MDRQHTRLKKIFHTVKVRNAATIRELAEMLQVSEMTIRRDLRVLNNDGLVNLIHGGAVLNPGAQSIDDASTSRYYLSDQGARRREEKMRIGEKAASLIAPDDILIIDAGTTTVHVARHIPDNLPVTVLCYTLNTLLEIHRKRACKIIFAGGYYHEDTQTFESREGLRLISSVRATKAFVGAAGVSKDLGVTSPYHYEVESKTAIMKSSLTNILLVDSSKFDRVSTAYFADISDFDMIVTDSGISAEYEELIRGLGVTLHVVD